MRRYLFFAVLFCYPPYIYGIDRAVPSKSVEIPVSGISERCILSKVVNGNLVVNCENDAKGTASFYYSPSLEKIPSGSEKAKAKILGKTLGDSYTITNGTYTYTLRIDDKPAEGSTILDAVSGHHEIALQKEAGNEKKVWKVTLEEAASFNMITYFQFTPRGDIMVILPIFKEYKTFVSIWRYSDEGELINKKVFAQLLFDSRNIKRVEFSADGDMWLLLQEDVEPDRSSLSHGCLRRGFVYCLNGGDISIKNLLSLEDTLPMVADMMILANGDVYVLSRNWIAYDSIYSAFGQMACGDNPKPRLLLHRYCGLAGGNIGKCSDYPVPVERKIAAVDADVTDPAEFSEKHAGEDFLTGNDVISVVKKYVMARSKKGYWTLKSRMNGGMIKLKVGSLKLKTMRKNPDGICLATLVFKRVDNDKPAIVEFYMQFVRKEGMVKKARFVEIEE